MSIPEQANESNIEQGKSPYIFLPYKKHGPQFFQFAVDAEDTGARKNGVKGCSKRLLLSNLINRQSPVCNRRAMRCILYEHGGLHAKGAL